MVYTSLSQTHTVSPQDGPHRSICSLSYSPGGHYRALAHLEVCNSPYPPDVLWDNRPGVWFYDRTYRTKDGMFAVDETKVSFAGSKVNNGLCT